MRVMLLILATLPPSNWRIWRYGGITMPRPFPCWSDSLRLRPDALVARADLGRAYLHLGQYQGAAEQLERAAAADQQGDIHFQLATVLRKLGRNQQADQAGIETDPRG